MLTILGILLGFFVILLQSPEQAIQAKYIVLTGLGSSISMLISGTSGSYLSERAEQRREKKRLDHAMGIFSAEEMKAFPEEEPEEKDIQKAMITTIEIKDRKKFSLKRKTKKIKTIHEKAETFTIIIVSFVNGISPFFGGIVAITPFFFVTEAGIMSFLYSFVIILICIVLLGIFLGTVSKESIPKNILQMLVAFIVTIVIIIIIL